MKAHLARQTRALERCLVELESEVTDAKQRAEAEDSALAALQAERQSFPLSARVPVALVRKLEKAKSRTEHAQWMWDKACGARNDLRNLIQGGKLEL